MVAVPSLGNEGDASDADLSDADDSEAADATLGVPAEGVCGKLGEGFCCTGLESPRRCEKNRTDPSGRARSAGSVPSFRRIFSSAGTDVGAGSSTRRRFASSREALGASGAASLARAPSSSGESDGASRFLVDAAALERSINEFAESSDCETAFVALISRRGAFVAFVRDS